MKKLSTSAGVSVDIMHILRGAHTQCHEVGGKLLVCNYHQDRSNCNMIGITDGGGVPTAPLNSKFHQKRLNVTPQIRKLFKRMASDFSVAGSWYLVQEQREWLEKYIAEILKNTTGTCRVMVSGVAGYAHFFSYLQILLQAARKAQFNIARYEIDVVDMCLTPLLEIEAILAHPHRYSGWLPKPIRFMGVSIWPNLHNRLFIRRMVNDIRQLNIRTIQASVEHLPESCGKYDIITEHFLTSMMEKESSLINASRQSYSQILKPRGHLLMASGYPNRKFLNNFLAIHKQNGFTYNEDEIIKVWDPFGLSKGMLIQILYDRKEKFCVPLDNIMAHFTYAPDATSSAEEMPDA